MEQDKEILQYRATAEKLAFNYEACREATVHGMSAQAKWLSWAGRHAEAIECFSSLHDYAEALADSNSGMILSITSRIGRATASWNDGSEADARIDLAAAQNTVTNGLANGGLRRLQGLMATGMLRFLQGVIGDAGEEERWKREYEQLAFECPRATQDALGRQFALLGAACRKKAQAWGKESVLLAC